LGWVDADPKAGGSGELGDAGAGVAAEEGGLQGKGVALDFEGAGLDAPFSGGVGGGVGVSFETDLGGAHAVEANGLCGGFREIEDTGLVERAAVGDADGDLLAVDEVGDADDGAEGEGAVGGGEALAVVGGAVGCAVAAGAVPAGHAGLNDGGLAGGGRDDDGSSAVRRCSGVCWRRGRLVGLLAGIVMAADGEEDDGGGQKGKHKVAQGSDRTCGRGLRTVWQARLLQLARRSDDRPPYPFMIGGGGGCVNDGVR
jgi:hypothetical protein